MDARQMGEARPGGSPDVVVGAHRLSGGS